MTRVEVVITAWCYILPQLKHVMPIFIIIPPRWWGYPGIFSEKFWTVPRCAWRHSSSQSRLPVLPTINRDLLPLHPFTSRIINSLLFWLFLTRRIWNPSRKRGIHFIMTEVLQQICWSDDNLMSLQNHQKRILKLGHRRIMSAILRRSQCRGEKRTHHIVEANSWNVVVNDHQTGALPRSLIHSVVHTQEACARSSSAPRYLLRRPATKTSMARRMMQLQNILTAPHGFKPHLLSPRLHPYTTSQLPIFHSTLKLLLPTYFSLVKH